MKNVFFVQANMRHGKSNFLPYSIGCLAAYSWQFEEIKQNYVLKDLLYRKEPIEKVLSRYEQADIVAFSCSIWTFEYNKILAQQIKEKNPQCIIIFGGHHICEDIDILSEYDYVDYLIYGEGERPFKMLLDVISGREKIENVPNIAYRHNHQTVQTKRIEYHDLEGYLSPYLEGYFDKILAEDQNTDFVAIMETNRGCPYQCP